LLEAVKGSRPPIRPIQDIQRDVEKICGGKPQRPRLTQRSVVLVKWVDGSVIDTVWGIE
jgi:citrate lyase subunit alpha/citrate CoA-transferase